MSLCHVEKRQLPILENAMRRAVLYVLIANSLYKLTEAAGRIYSFKKSCLKWLSTLQIMFREPDVGHRILLSL